MYRILLQKFPNNELRATMSAQRFPRSDSSIGDVLSEAGEIGSCVDATILDTDLEVSPLTLVSNSESPSAGLKPGFGMMPKPTKFGLRAKRTLIRAGGTIDLLHGSQPQILLTGTLPGSTIQAMAALAAYSSYVVDRLKTWLYDLSPTSTSMYAWEFQRRGALHIHYVHVCRCAEEARKIKDKFHQFWYDLLVSVMMRSGVDVFERESGGTWYGLPKMVQAHVAFVQKSVAGYIAKYLGKGSLTSSERHFCPTRWYGVSRNLLKELAENTHEYKKEFLSFLEAKKWMNKCHNSVLDLAHKCYRYLHKAGGGESLVAYAHKEDMEEICERTMEMSGFSCQTNQYRSTTRAGERFRLLLTSIHGYFMKQLPAGLLDEYLKELASMSCLCTSRFTLSESFVGSLLAWNATLLYGRFSSHLSPTQSRILIKERAIFITKLLELDCPELKNWTLLQLEAFPSTNSKVCYAGRTTSDSEGHPPQVTPLSAQPEQLTLFSDC